jgi:hypothetical protein
MLFQGIKGLRDVSVSSKIGITAVLLIAGIGYLLGFLNIYVTYSPVDQQPGLSIQDIRLSFWGARDQTRLEQSIDGSMRPYFASDADYQATKDWIHAGAPEAEFPAIQAIFDQSCNTCHSAEVATAGVVLTSYAEVTPYLAQDTGKSIPRLISISHTHLLPTLTIITILVFIFSLAAYPQGLKSLVIAYAYFSILFDIGSWWLAKLSPALSILVMLGGIALAVSFLVLIVLSLYDLWLGPSPAAEAPRKA